MSLKLTGSLIVGISMFLCLNAETVVLQNGIGGYTGCFDTYLIMNSAVAQGTKDKLEVEGYHCAACIDERLLIKFDLSSIPKTAVVTKATLSLFSTAQPRPGSGTVNVYRISKAWEEATANWTKATSSVSWATAGGDYDPTAVSTYTYGEEVNVWHDVDVTAAVSKFVKDPEVNFGLHFFMEPAMYTVRYASSNSVTQANKPKLTVEINGTSIVSPAITRKENLFSVSVKGNALVAFSPDKTIRSISLRTLRGQMVLHVSVNGTMGLVDVSTVPSGMYMISLENNTTMVSKRIAFKK